MIKMIRKKEAKIVILGSADSGKTTTIENLLDRKNEKITKIEHNGTTVALDYGNTIINGERIHIFASPGQERFKFMREILSNGLDGAIVVIDNSIGITATDANILEKLNNKSIPHVIFANKQDISQGIPESEHIKDNTKVIPTIALNSEGIHEGLDELLKMMKS
jgi:small GTP-binding protein